MRKKNAQAGARVRPACLPPFIFLQKKEKISFLVLTSGEKGVESRSRHFTRQGNRKERTEKMKTIAIVLGLTALTAAGNTLPPTPENTLPPTPEMFCF